MLKKLKKKIYAWNGKRTLHPQAVSYYGDMYLETNWTHSTPHLTRSHCEPNFGQNYHYVKLEQNKRGCWQLSDMMLYKYTPIPS